MSTGVNPQYTAKELSRHLKIADTEWIVTNEEGLPTTLEAIKLIGRENELKNRIILKGGKNKKGLLIT